jgi:hypothetical protein
LDTFQRDYLGKSNREIRSIIRTNNKFAHDPLIILDASLYTPGETNHVSRIDISTFEKLYGFTPTKVAELDAAGCKHLLKAAEAYASAQLQKNMTDES